MSAVNFSGITGQDKALKILTSQIAAGKVPHAYLFSGPEGVGKKKAAIEFAKALECASAVKPCGACISCMKIEKGIHPDVHIMDFKWQAAILDEEPEKQAQFKIDSIRELQKEISFMPVEGRYRIFIVDPADKMNQEAANSFLKTLEEPPRDSVIILISILREGLPKTVVSRCQNVGFRPLLKNEIAGILSEINGGTPQEYLNIVKFAGGSVSRAIDLLELFEAESSEDGAFMESKVWNAAREGNLEPSKLMEENGRFFSNRQKLEKFLYMMLMKAQVDIEEENCADTHRIMLAIEKIIAYKKALRYNVSPVLISNVLFFELSKIFKE